MSKSRNKWLKTYLKQYFDEKHPNSDYRKIKKWWANLSAEEKKEISKKVRSAGETDKK